MVNEEIKSILSFWLEKGVDGIRLVSQKYVDDCASQTDKNYLNIHSKSINEIKNTMNEFSKVDEQQRLLMLQEGLLRSEGIIDLKEITNSDIVIENTIFNNMTMFTSHRVYRAISDALDKVKDDNLYPNWRLIVDGIGIDKSSLKLRSALIMITALLPGSPWTTQFHNYWESSERTEDLWTWKKEIRGVVGDCGSFWLPSFNSTATNTIPSLSECGSEEILMNLLKYLIQLRYNVPVLNEGFVGLYAFDDGIFAMQRMLPQTRSMLLVWNTYKQSLHMNTWKHVKGIPDITQILATSPFFIYKSLFTLGSFVDPSRIVLGSGDCVILEYNSTDYTFQDELGFPPVLNFNSTQESNNHLEDGLLSNYR